MRKVMKKPPTKKESTETENKPVITQPSANQRRFLEILITGTEAEEPTGVLAGASFKFSS